MAIHPVLDRMVLMLDQAWISEIRQDQKPLVQRFKAVVQSFQNPYVVPLEAQLQNLMEAAQNVGFAIPCMKCRAAWYQEITRKIQVRYLLEQGKRKEAVWLWLRSEFWGKVWALRALPILFARKPQKN